MGSIYSLQYCRPAAVCAYEINFCRRSLLIAYSFTLRYRIKSSIFCNHQNRRLFIDVFSPHVLLLRRIILYRCCQSRSLSLYTRTNLSYLFYKINSCMHSLLKQAQRIEQLKLWDEVLLSCDKNLIWTAISLGLMVECDLYEGRKSVVGFRQSSRPFVGFIIDKNGAMHQPKRLLPPLH